MQIERLKPNVTVTDSIFSEPVQVLIVTQFGESVKLIGKEIRENDSGYVCS